MKWNIILKKRSSETLILFSVILMMVMIAYMHKRSLSNMEQTITSIYEDRLVAKDYIFDLSKMINDKKTAISSGNERLEEIVRTNHAIDRVIKRYEETRLTEEEQILWQKLKDDINHGL